jgi:hypothetical protein
MFEWPKVWFSFNVVDARIDARRGSLGGAKSRQARPGNSKLVFAEFPASSFQFLP